MAADTWTVERTTTIDAPPERVYDQLENLHHGRSWALATRLTGLFASMDKMIGPDFEKGLDRLRRVAEARS